MSHSADSKATVILNNFENPIKNVSDCQSLTDHQNTISPQPLKLEMNVNAENGKFHQFMDFVERVMIDKNSNQPSDEVQDELINWFPFVNKNMTVFLNIDLHFKTETGYKVDTLEKTLAIPKIKFPEPLARFSPASKEPNPIPIDNEIMVEDIKTKIAPKKLFIPGFKNKLESEINKPFESSSQIRNIQNNPDIELDNLYLSTLLRKKNGDLPDVTRITVNRHFRPDEINERLISNHILKVRSYWEGSNVSYPHSFKKLSLGLTKKSNENCVVETLDHSKKLIPTMFTEQNSELWNVDGN